MNVVLTGATVVRSLDPPIVERADLHVRDGRIAALGPDLGTGDPDARLPRAVS